MWSSCRRHARWGLGAAALAWLVALAAPDPGWARTLVLLGIDKVDEEDARNTVSILLKYRSDIEKAIKDFSSNSTTHFDTQPASG